MTRGRFGADPSAPTLTVEGTQTGLRFRLDLPAGEHEPLQEELHQRVDRAALEALEASAHALLRGGTRPGFGDEARLRGGVLYRSLIPPPLRSTLLALNGPLLVSTTLHGIPWELLHDGEEFWGLRYALGRRLVTDRARVTVREVAPRERPRALVIAADPARDLPFVLPEMEQVCAILAGFADVVAVAGRLASIETVTAHLGRAFDLIHFAGHVVTLESGESALLLADGKPLPSSVIEATLAGRPLVVINGCGSAETAAISASSWERRLAGVVHAFLFGGAAVAIGTLADVGDRHAAALAGAFYRRLFEGISVGEALRGARVECRGEPAIASSPAWLSFGVYGAPTFTLLGGTKDVKVDERQPPAAILSRRSLVRAGLIAVAAAVPVAIWMARRARAPTTREGLVVGVMDVRVRTGDVPEWMRTFTRSALNTSLKEIDGIAVFSQEKIDFLCQSRGLCGIAGAEALGMTKMITLALSLGADSLALDVEVVDIANNGLLEANARVQGDDDDLITLQNRLLFQLLTGIGVTPTAAERERILSQRTNDMLDGYRMLMDTLGGGGLERSGVSGADPGVRSWLAVAHAAGDEEAAILDVLQRYERALVARDIAALAALQGGMEARQRDGLEQYFGNAKELKVAFHDVEILVEGNQALATYSREDTFVDARNGRTIHLKVEISSRLSRGTDGWVLQMPE